MKRMVALDHPIRSRRCLSSRYLVCPQSRPRVVGEIGIEVESMEGSSYNNSILPFSIIHLTP